MKKNDPIYQNLVLQDEFTRLGKLTNATVPKLTFGQKAKALRDEYESITGTKPAYPKSKIAYNKLSEELDEYKKTNVKDEDFIFRQTPYVIGTWLRGWEMNPPNQVDPKLFMDNVRDSIHKKMVEELVELKSVKFQLALKINLKKEGPDGKEEFTDPVFPS